MTDVLAAACDALSARGTFPPTIGRGLAERRPDALRAAVMQEIDAGRREGLREWLERLADLDEFAAWARVQMARLHRSADEFAEALAAYDELFRRFPERATPHWSVGRGRCLVGLERYDEAETQAREAVAAFPRAQEPLAFLAQLLARLGRDPEALWVWRALHAEIAAPDLDAFLGLHAALKACGHTEEGKAVQARLLALSPDDPRALRALAGIAAEYGETAAARELWAALTAQRSESSRAEDWAALARAQHECGEVAEAQATLASLERRFPASPLAVHERLRFAKTRETGLEDLRALVETGRARFPQDAELRAQWVWILLSEGRSEEAERETQALEAAGAGAPAKATRLRVEADKGDVHLRAFLASWDVSGFSVAETLQVAYGLIEIRAGWAFDFGDALLADAMRRFPGLVRLKLMRARFLIARRDEAGALALLDSMPSAHVGREALELRAFAEARRGRIAAAKAIWAQALASAYYAAVHAPMRPLARVSPAGRPAPGEGVTAYVVFRNEAAQMADFLAHHRRLGVRRFVFFDHGSDDGGRALALAEADVEVYDCPESYQLSWSGRRWINEIVDQEGRRGWGLQIDMDERLVYPGWETVALDRFVGWLEAQGFEAVRGFMLDLFAPRLVDDGGRAPPFSEHRWFDSDYEWFGTPRPPYLSPSGGVRSRLFEAREFLHKVPLWRLDAGWLLNSHETTAMRFADVSAALLHYKLMNVALRGRDATAGTAFLEADADIEAIRRHSRYAARLNRLWTADLVKPGVSRELGDSWALAEAGLLDASPAYRDWAAVRSGAPGG